MVEKFSGNSLETLQNHAIKRIFRDDPCVPDWK